MHQLWVRLLFYHQLHQVLKRLFVEQAAGNPFLERQRFHSKVRERLKDRIPIYRNLVKVAFLTAVVPNSNDRELIKLPDALSALYYLVRPARLAHKRWSQSFRRSNPTL